MEGFFTSFSGKVSGYIGSPIEMRYTPSGKAVASVSVGVGGGDGRKATWVKLVFWEENAELANKLLTAKGMAVVALGRIAVRAFITKGGEARADVSLTPEQLSYAVGGVFTDMVFHKRAEGEEVTSKPADIPGDLEPEDIPFVEK